MRLWSIHPKYLDAKGLVALWRETLLAKHVLEGKTKGYRNHPQLNRFKKADKPIYAMNQYLAAVYDEACARNYNFNKAKIDDNFQLSTIAVTNGQIQYETTHLLGKLKKRDEDKFNTLQKLNMVYPHPMFKIVEGPIEEWEVI